MNIADKDKVHFMRMLGTLIDADFTDLEFEVLFKSKSPSMKKNIDRIGFENVIRRLKAYGLKPTIVPDVLDIKLRKGCKDRPTNMRVSIHHIESIRKYCSKNSLQGLGNEVTFTYKSLAKDANNKLIYPLQLDDYHLKFNLKNEKTYKRENFIDRNNIIDNWKHYYKFFRYKKRFSFKTDTLSIDLTVVKSSSYRDGNPVYTKTFLESNTLRNKPKYEIEIEFIGNQHSYTSLIPPTELVTTQQSIMRRKEQMIGYILEDFFTYIRIIYNALDHSFYLTSKKTREHILQMYHSITGSYYFKAPLAITLKKEQAIQLNDYTNIINIRKGYTVTDKADGIRNLLLILPKEGTNIYDERAELYVMNRQNEIKTLGVSIPIQYANTILDGELITKDINGKTIQTYMAFDIYYLQGRNIMDKHLNERIGTPEKKGIMIEFIDEIVSSFVKDNTNPFLLQSKRFFYGNVNTDKKDNKIFSYCQTILQNAKANHYPYHIDGLIFTPIEEGIWGDGKPKQNQLRWDHTFKWKPPEENTIDFHVKIELDHRGNERIYSFETDRTITNYKKCILFVGYDDQRHSPFNAFRLVNENPSYKTGFHPIQFMPINPYIEEAYVTYVPIKNGQIFCEDGGQIKDNSIIEFSYQDEKIMRWKPLRVRNSKGPNALNTALNVWESIHNPLTIEMMSTGKHIENDEDKYYIRQKKRKREEMYTYRLQEFHNRYVKNKLLSFVSKENDTLLDVSVGKGGDLNRWVDAKLSFVLGQDISQDGLIDPTNGACVRYINIKKRKETYPTVFFIWGDSHKNISSGESALDKLNKYYLDVLYGTIAKKMVLNKHLQSQWGKAKDGFDIVSCQFAIHYFFKNKETIDGFLQNIDDNVKENGYFIGTCLDGSTVFSKLNTTTSGKIGSKDNDTKDFIWYIKRKYDNTTVYKSIKKAKTHFNDLGETSLGMPIDVYVDSINRVYEEYLVHFNYLKMRMEQLGFTLLNGDTFDTLFTQMIESTKSGEDYGKAPDMTPQEKSLSFMNRQFVFQRTSMPKRKPAPVVEEPVAPVVEEEPSPVVVEEKPSPVVVEDIKVPQVAPSKKTQKPRKKKRKKKLIVYSDSEDET